MAFQNLWIFATFFKLQARERLLIHRNNICIMKKLRLTQVSVSTSTHQKIRIFWKIVITFLTLAQNPFNYSKRFNIILEINEGKLVHNYGNFNYKYMYFLKKCIFFENFYLITGKNNKEKTTKLNNKLHPSVSILCCITSSLDDSFNATRHAVYQLLTFMGSYLIPTSLDGIFQLLRSIWLMFMQFLFHNPP